MYRNFTLLFVSALLLATAAKGQSTTVNGHPANGNPPLSNSQLTGQEPYSQPGALDDNPEFKRLSPQNQAWVRSMAERLNAAIASKDLNAFDALEREVSRHALIGKNVCGHVADEGIFVDASVLNDAHNAEALLARWLDPQPGTVVHSAIVTGGGRCVAADATTIEGKTIVRLLPTSLGVSKQGIVAYEAIYVNGNDPSQQKHRGVFIEYRYVYDLDPLKASAPDSPSIKDEDRDFAWDDANTRLVPKLGIAFLPSTSPSISPQANQSKSSGCNSQSQPAASGKPLTKVPLTIRQKLGLDPPKGDCGSSSK